MSCAEGGCGCATCEKEAACFILALLGVTYTMTRLIHELAESAWVQQEATTSSSAHGLLPLDLGAPVFARADLITPPNANELALKKNDIVAVTVKLDAPEQHGGRLAHGGRRRVVEGYSREGHEGWFPNKSTSWRGTRRRSRRISLPMYTCSHCIFIP